MGARLCVTIDEHDYRDKAEAKRSIAAITRRMQSSSYTLLPAKEFVRLIGRGHAWCGGCFRKKRDGWGDFVCMRLFGLDFDGVKGGAGRRADVSPEDVVGRCREYGVVPLAYYHTFSSTPERPRFRLVVDVGVPFEEKGQAQAYAKLLLRLFPEADKACSNLNRIFFGGGSGAVAISVSTATGPKALEVLRARLGSEEEQRLPSVRAAKSLGASRSQKERRDGLKLQADKMRAPLLELIRLQTGVDGKECGDRIDFHLCPVCGHKDCFSYYVKTNSWVCFSNSNKTGIRGGSYIDFLRATHMADSVADAIGLMREAIDKGLSQPEGSSS